MAEPITYRVYFRAQPPFRGVTSGDDLSLHEQAFKVLLGGAPDESSRWPHPVIGQYYGPFSDVEIEHAFAAVAGEHEQWAQKFADTYGRTADDLFAELATYSACYGVEYRRGDDTWRPLERPLDEVRSPLTRHLAAPQFQSNAMNGHGESWFVVGGTAPGAAPSVPRRPPGAPKRADDPKKRATWARIQELDRRDPPLTRQQLAREVGLTERTVRDYRQTVWEKTEENIPRP